MGRRAVGFLLIAVVLAACGGGSGGTAAPSSGGGQATDKPDASKPAEGEPTPGTALTACELVTPADIEAALDLEPGTVSEGELKQEPTVLDPAVNECKYIDDSWGGLNALVTPTDGVNVYDALVDVYMKDAEALEIGDGALWFEKNDRGYFLKGSVIILLQFTHVKQSLDSFRDPTVEIGTSAVGRI